MVRENIGVLPRTDHSHGGNATPSLQVAEIETSVDRRWVGRWIQVTTYVHVVRYKKYSYSMLTMLQCGV